ncbi:MAG: flavodoxin family protein [Dehalococcoidia bacterium]|nr:flavodoxin family protein [Dehalococcoidia bacterium]
MKILGISCSPRKGGNTEVLLRAALETAQAEGADIEFYSVSGKHIRFCDGCYVCRRNGECHIKDDDMAELFEKMLVADGILFGSPVYFWDVTGQAKTIIDRTFAVSAQRNFKNKAAGAIVAAGRNGTSTTISTLYSFFTGHRMIVIGNAIGYGNDKGSVKDDAPAMANATGLAKAMVRFLKTGKM